MTDIDIDIAAKRLDEVRSMDYINFILECAASSCQFGKVLEYEQGEKIHRERANLNVFLALPFGSGKTTTLVDCKNSLPANDLTFGGMVGTISRDGEFSPGASIMAAGKVLLIDEANRIPKDVKDAMNNLLEQRSFPRKLGFAVKRPITKSGKFYKIVVKGGYINCQSRLSCIASSMITNLKEFDGASTSDIASLTRFSLIRFLPSIEYYERLTRGESIFNIKPSIKPIEEFHFRDFLQAHQIFWNKFRSMPQFNYFDKFGFERGAIGRFLQDLCRMSAYLASVRNSEEVTLSDFNHVMKFLPMMASNYICANLTELEFRLLEILSNGEKSQSELADSFYTSQSTISRTIDTLKARGLL